MKKAVSLSAGFVLLFAASTALRGCGADYSSAVAQDGSLPESEVEGSASIEPMLAENTAPTLTQQPNTKNTSTLSAVRADLSMPSEIKFTFNVVLDASLSDDFTYAKENWALAFSEGGKEDATTAKTAVTTSQNVSVDDAGISGCGAKKTCQGSVVLTYRFPNDKLPENLTDAGKQKLVVYIYYHPTKGAWTDPAAIKGADPIVVKQDVGIIKAAPSVETSVGDRNITIKWSKPSNLASVAYTSGAEQLTGETSSDASYLVMYWDVEKCKQESQWTFKTNKEVGDARDVTCTYPDEFAADGMCNVGTCTGLGDAIKGVDPFEILAPSDIPTEAGKAGAKQVGCYNVMLVKGQYSMVLTDLELDKRYGAMVWVRDSADRIGRTRSNCRVATVTEMKLSGAEKNPAAKRGKDCFVVSAASGNANSVTVDYWRFVRDVYLENTRFVSWYYNQNGERMAAWLDSHAWLKPAVHGTLKASGWFIYTSTNFFFDVRRAFNATVDKVTKVFVSGLFFETAFAQNGEGASAEEGGVPPASEPAIDTAPAVAPSPAPEATSLNATPEPAAEPAQSPSPAAEAPSATPAPSEPAQTPTPAPPSDLPISEKQEVGSASSEGDLPEYKEGSSSSNIQIMVSQLQPAEDLDLYKGYYPKVKPKRVSVAQTFRLFDLAGEFGGGLFFSGMSVSGTVPKTLVRSDKPVDPSIQGKPISYYTLGGGLLIDYRLRIGSSPYFWPRLAAGGSYDRWREEGAVDKDAKDENGNQVEPLGYTVWGPTVFGRAALEFSLPQIFGGESIQARESYDLEDFTLSVFAEYVKDLSTKRTSLTGMHFGAGVGLLLL